MFEERVEINPHGYIETMQQEILDTFGITKNDLASACGVTPSILDSWRKQQKINHRVKGMKRLFLLAQAATNWQDSGCSPIGSKYEDKYFGDTSLKDLLNADEIVLDTIQFLGSRYNITHLR